MLIYILDKINLSFYEVYYKSLNKKHIPFCMEIRLKAD